MKNNKKLYIIIGILGVLLILLGGFLVYDKILNNENSNEKTSSGNETLVSKLNINKDWIYNADYNLPTDKESYYGYSDHSKLISAKDLVVPYININSNDAKQANKEIYQLYETLINDFNTNSKEEINFTLVEYKSYINNNILSVVIITESAGTWNSKHEYYTYNFDLTNGLKLSYEDVYKIAGFNSEDIDLKVEDSITTVMKKKLENYQYSNEENFAMYNNGSIDNYKKAISNKNLKYFLSNNMELNIIFELNLNKIFASPDYYEIITISSKIQLPKWAEYLLDQNITKIEVINRTCTVEDNKINTSSETITKEQLKNILTKMTASKLIKHYYGGMGGPCLGDIVVKYNNQEVSLFLFRYIRTNDEKINTYLEEEKYEIKKDYESDYLFMYDWDPSYINTIIK